MSRNFGLGSRVMSDAGRMALDRAAGRGDVSFSTAATQADRWASFSAWAKEQGVGRMERINCLLAQQSTICCYKKIIRIPF